MSPISRDHKRRLFWLLTLLIALFTLLIYQYFRLQIVEGEKWKQLGDRQHFFEVREPFVRGGFFAANGLRKTHYDEPQRLVFNLLKFHLYIDSLAIDAQYRDELADHLVEFLDLPKERLLKELGRKSRSRKIASWLESDMREALLSWWGPFAKKRKIAKNALFFVSDYKRSYPYGKLLGQLLHTIQYQKDELTGQGLPTGGLELYFDSYLRGHFGRRKMMRSPINAYEVGEVSIEPQNGADVYLTIDLNLQAICEEEIARGVKETKSKSGFATMMDPNTGRILAIAQYPFFYPEVYPSYFLNLQTLDQTRIKAIQDAQEPGSNMKALNLCLALSANEDFEARGEKILIDPEEKLPCSKGQFPGRSKPLTDTHLHKYLNMAMALQRSSNIYLAEVMIRIIERLGETWYRNNLTQVFGFGARSGIELPSESAGLVPTPGKKHPNGTLEWSKSTPYSLGMGHNILATNMQMLRAYAVLANGGYLVNPTIVDRVVRQRGENQEFLVDNRNRKKEQFPKVLSRSVVDKTIDLMKYSTKPDGTARKGDVPGYTEVGKTSTPKKVINGVYSERNYCPCFIGFTPASDAAFVLIITFDEPQYGYIPGRGLNHHGGTACAPVFRQIAMRALDYLGVPPDDPYGYPVGDPRRDKSRADWLNEVEALREKYQSWNNS